MFKSISKASVAIVSAVAATAFFSAPSHAIVSEFSEDYESFTAPADPGVDDNDDLSDAGWRIFAQVFAGGTDASGNGTGLQFDASGNPLGFKFQYGLFDAPNGGPGFSSIASGDAPANGSGAQYLNIYSDYNCCGGPPATEGHGPEGSGTDVVRALVLKEFAITALDIGKVVTFSFDAKRPDVMLDEFMIEDLSAAVGNGCGTAPCTATAFVKTLDPMSGFIETNLIVEDMTAISQAGWTAFSMQIDLTDPALEGQLLQVGFETIASNFDNTGVYYDNVTLSTIGGAGENVPVPFAALLGFAALVGVTGIRALRKRV